LAHKALDTYGEGINTAEKYLGQAETYSGESRTQVNKVKDYLIEKRDVAWDNVQSKGAAYNKFAKEQRAIAYGTCTAVCASTGIATAGTSCLACYGTAAMILENELADFREKNKKLRDDYNDMADEVGVVLDSIMDRIKSLTGLDEDIVEVGKLIEEAKAKYKDVKGGDIKNFFTKSANDEDGAYTDFLAMLENIINYEKNLQKCGKPDCESSCM